jgi:hypothetical protein
MMPTGVLSAAQSFRIDDFYPLVNATLDYPVTNKEQVRSVINFARFNIVTARTNPCLHTSFDYLQQQLLLTVTDDCF